MTSMDEQAVALFFPALGQQLQRARLSHSLSVADVAYRSHVLQSVVERAEAGQDVGLRMVARICVVLGERLSTIADRAEAAVSAQGSAPWFDQPTDIIDVGMPKMPPPEQEWWRERRQ